ncbi:MAG: LacI family DNA-binding transcriptional regulator [Paenibacillaceae bacterium]|nr:LacI family DNA-binding transcriptional regulator [Paenibacillaceae bacterium]
MNVTIRQIAAQAGVSRGTVDRVLNGRPGVKPEIREKIMNIAEEMQYVPNVAGKALAFSKKPVMFGVVMPPKEIDFFDDIRKGIESAAAELKGFGIQLDYRHVNNRLPEDGVDAIRRLIAEGASGILFAAMDDESIRLSIDDAVERGVPVITFNTDVEQSKRTCFVGQDLPKSGRIAAGLMSRMLQGKAQVLVVTGSMKFHAHRSRVDGFKAALAGSGIAIVRVMEGFDLYEDTYRRLTEALAAYPDIAGIYMATGHVGACLDAVREAGIEGKVRIICNDLMPETEAAMRQGRIDCTIVQNPVQQGYRSFRLLHDLVFAGKKPESETIFTETSIVIPESL